MSFVLAALTGIVLQSGTAQEPMEFRRIEVAPAESVAIGSIGSGPPIIIVPGMLGSAFGFRDVIGPLAREGYRVVVVDPLGTGSSPHPEKADYSLSAQSVRIGQAAGIADVSRAVFLCHSTAAAMCFRLAHANPNLVAGIVSINGGPAERQATSGLRLALKLAGVIRFIAGDGWARGKVKDGLKKSSADPAWVTEDILAAYTGYYQDGMGGALSTLKRMASSEEPAPLAPLLPEILSPVRLLLGTGTTEGVPSAEEVVRMGALPRLEIDSIANAGVYIQEENPEAVVAATLSMANRMLGQPRLAVPDLLSTPIRLRGRVRN